MIDYEVFITIVWIVSALSKVAAGPAGHNQLEVHHKVPSSWLWPAWSYCRIKSSKNSICPFYLLTASLQVNLYAQVFYHAPTL